MNLLHTVRFEIDRYTGLDAVFQCRARKGDPFCRIDCTAVWCHHAPECAEKDGHSLLNSDSCLFVKQMCDFEAASSHYRGPRTSARPGLIVPTRSPEDGSWEWRYADPEEEAF